ncbi:MAG: hypothetical protein CSA22_05065 [Deltaproteobacteria bacterium]|nr:MAG: hypothetical protein CSA22_05065 [Deltaproteobacteria bacterium]
MNGMKHWILSIICCCGALAISGSLNANAQDEPIDGGPVMYTIEKGDTLWDISQRFLDSPFRWPELWEQNTYINNPDLIYPGNELLIDVANGNILPVEVIDGASAYAESDSVEPFPEQTDTATSMENAPTRDQAHLAASPERKAATFIYPSIDTVGYVRTEPIEGIATLLRNIDDNFLIAEHDRVYVKSRENAPELVPGKVYTAYRLTQHVIDPKTGKKVGVHHFPTGRVRIDALGEEGALATVVKSYRSLKAGDRLIPYTPKARKIYRTPPTPGLTGHILMSDELHSGYAQDMIVFINKGRADGIDLGQEYTLYQKEKGMPPLDIGRILVLHTEETVSSALITQSAKTIHDGDLFHAVN